MKFIQLNTWCCKLSPEIIRLFEHERPDITALQEVISAKQGGKILDTIEEVVEKYPFKYQYDTPLVQFNYMNGKARRGNMITSQFPITDTSQLWTHGEFAANFDYATSDGGFNSARNIAHAAIDTPTGKLHVLTLHGYHVSQHKNGNDETLRACQELVTMASALDGAIIIAGDFNLAPNSESMQLVSQSFRNLSTEFEFKTTRNHFTSKTEVCDYILVNDKVTVNRMYMSDIIASDHNALVLDFDIAASGSPGHEKHRGVSHIT